MNVEINGGLIDVDRFAEYDEVRRCYKITADVYIVLPKLSCVRAVSADDLPGLSVANFDEFHAGDDAA